MEPYIRCEPPQQLEVATFLDNILALYPWFPVEYLCFKLGSCLTGRLFLHLSTRTPRLTDPDSCLVVANVCKTNRQTSRLKLPNSTMGEFKGARY